MRQWGAFLLLGTIWGSSFLWIKIAVGEIGPATLVSFRLLFGAVGLLAVAFLTGQGLREHLRRYFPLYLFMAFFNTTLPFILISWAETRIDSALAAILNATAPLFAIVISHYMLADEKITLTRVAGLIVGFVGVVVLMSRELSPQGVHGSIWGYVAMVAASASYGLSATFSRRHLRGHPPLVQATMVVVIADVLTWAAVPFMDRPIILPQAGLTWFALAWLGLLGSCTAYMLYFYLINAWGATRATIVTYVFPVVGLILGIVFLNESADWRLLAGSALIVGGIAVVNRRSPGARAPVRVGAEQPQKT
ncbi:MAG TPA: DMT family transporter [bacterium]|nr:DMT family transporter [bacterium]